MLGLPELAAASSIQRTNFKPYVNRMWLIWLIVAAIFAVAEVFTTSFVLLWFGVGAGVAALLALLGVTSLLAQITAFLLVSTLLVIASRTIFENFFVRSSLDNELKTGAAQMIGQIGTVTVASQGRRNEAEVRAYGSVWTALPLADEPPLLEGETVMIERVEGNTLHVRRPVPRAPLFSAPEERV